MGPLRYPPSIDWELTSACNHNCIHCYNYWRGRGTQTPHSYEADEYLLLAQRIADSKPVSVQITGGEPLLVWGQAEDAVRLLIQEGICVSINTNATLVTDDIARFLAQNGIDAFVSFPCSRHEVFDRVVNKRGAAERAEAGIRTLLRHNVRVSLNMVVTQLNLPYVYETAHYVWKTFHVPYFSATKASFPQNASASFQNQMLDRQEFNEMLEILLRVKEETGMRVDSAWVYSLCGFRSGAVREEFGFNRKCGCGRYNFVVDASGNMKACGCDGVAYGNLRETDFSNAIMWMTEWQDGSLLPEECKGCPELKYCGGGCRSDGFSAYGDRCALDSTADPANRGQTPSDTGKPPLYDDGYTVALPPGARLTQEADGVRLSHKTNYAFLTDGFAGFLRQFPTFSVAQLMVTSGKSREAVSRCVDSLLIRKLLVPTASAVGGNLPDCSRDGFSLLYSPYIDDSTGQSASDYSDAQYNSVRHSS